MDARLHHALEQCLASGDIARAAGFAQQALNQGDQSPVVLNLVAWCHEEAGEFVEARKLLERALCIAPGDPSITTAIGTTFRKEGRLDEAIAQFDETLRHHPDYAVAWLERGFAHEAIGSPQSAARDYRRAAACDPSLAPAHAGLAWLAAIGGNAAKVVEHARHAMAIEPGNATASYSLARIEIEQGQTTQAIERLETILRRSDIDDAKRIVALGLLARAMEKSGEIDRAFVCQFRANDLFAALHTDRLTDHGRTDSHTVFVRKTAEMIDRHAPRLRHTVAQNEGDDARRPLFLLGYPRSGTTLVETILAAAPGVATLEERATLIDADLAFLTSADGIKKLAGLTPPAIAQFRDAYWKRVAAFGAAPEAATIIDMDPLKSIKLPLIAKLFPDARVILMQRDPRDIVWSCFRTNFAPTSASLEFTTIKRAAIHYDAVMTLIDTCLTALPLDVHILKYEDLVADFDAATTALCTFSGIRWSSDLRQFHVAAKDRNVATASASQVRQALFNGSGRWRPFVRYLKPALPILGPWMRKFGYSE